MKNLAIIILGGAAVYLLYKSYKDSQQSQVVKQQPEPVKEEPKAVTCPEGEILCSNNQTCYNPAAKYIVDPCA